jgi:acetolactate synthase-1/2/3 large subunit
MFQLKTDLAPSYAAAEGERPPERLSGAEIVVRLLERQGVRCMAGIPGGAILPFYDALSRSTQITHVLARHEQGAGFIAQGWARATGEVAVCAASSGPGATNLVTALADAKMDSIPLVAITAQVPRAMIGTDAFQEVDACGITRPITKHNFLVDSTEKLLQVIPHAFRLAASGRPGPVLVDSPKDVLSQVIEVTEWPQPGGRNVTSSLREKPEAPDEAKLARAAAMIATAQRPVLYLGGGVIHADAAALAVTLAEKQSLPTTMTLMALGVLAPEHPLSLGMLGMHAARYTNLVLEECDLLIAVGARFDDRATGKVQAFCPRADIIHIDIDAAELNKIKTATVAINGDARSVLEALLARLGTAQFSGGREPWLARVGELKREFPLQVPNADDPRSHYGLIRAVAECAGDDAIVTTDVGQHQMWVAQVYPLKRPRQWLTSGGLGTMGFGMPAAIGAALASPDRMVLCFSGDGSLLMNIQELATAADLQVNVKVIVMNNGSLGLVHQQQTLFYGRNIFASKYARMPDFVAIARGFGVHAVDLDREADPRAALAAALATPGPVLINAGIDVREHVYPMVAPGAANRDMIVAAGD